MWNKALYKTLFLLLISFVLLSYNDDPPNGRTGAPFDGKCSDCHSNNNPGGYNGSATIVGLPDTIQPNTQYALQLKVMVSAGNPVRAGFQLVIVDKNHQNAGDLIAPNQESDTEFMNGREYLDHRSGKYFGGMPVLWNFKWVSPATADCNTIKFFYMVNFCNGSGDFGDFSIAFADSVYFAGAPPLAASVTVLQHNTCLEDSIGIAKVQANGGAMPYQYQWSNGSTDAQIEALPNGIYTVNVLSSEGCLIVDSTTISNTDTIPPQIICPISFTACAGDTVHYDLPGISDNCALGDTLPIRLSGLPNDTLFPLGSTELIFQATDQSGNKATCAFQVEIDSCPVGVSITPEKSPGLLLLPNPVTASRFSIQGLNEAPLALELFNLYGHLVATFPISAWPGPFFLTDIPEGVYGLHLLSIERRHRWLRLIKVR